MFFDIEGDQHKPTGKEGCTNKNAGNPEEKCFLRIKGNSPLLHKDS